MFPPPFREGGLGGGLQRRVHFGERGLRGAPGGRVLSPQQLLRLRRPRHQLAVQRDPVGVELRPPPGRGERVAHDREERGLYLWRVEETAAGTSGDNATLTGDMKPPQSGGFVLAHDDDRARTHVLLLAHHPLDVLLLVVAERLRGVFQEVRERRRLARRHRRRQVDEPPRVGGEPRHHLQRRRRLLLAHDDPPGEVRVDGAPAGHVGEVEVGRRLPPPFREGGAAACGFAGCTHFTRSRKRLARLPPPPCREGVGGWVDLTVASTRRVACPRARSPVPAPASGEPSAGRRTRTRCRCRCTGSPTPG